MRRVNSADSFLGGEQWHMDGSWDVVVVGLPYTGGSLSGGRANLGPGMLRSVSRIISPRPLSGGAPGWYDYTAGQLLCQGLTFADAGDLRLDALNTRQDLDRVPEILARLRETCRLLVVIGGDDSLTYWVHQNFAGVLVHLDAHEDAQPPRCPSGPTHADFVRHLELLPELRIVQYGLRGLVQGQPESPGESRSIAQDPAELKSLVAGSGSAACAVSLDVDVIEPELMRSTTAPMPDGLTIEQVTTAFRAVTTAGVPVRQFSVMEFAPHETSGRLDAMRMVHLVIRACHEWLV